MNMKHSHIPNGALFRDPSLLPPQLYNLSLLLQNKSLELVQQHSTSFVCSPPPRQCVAKVEGREYQSRPSCNRRPEPANQEGKRGLATGTGWEDKGDDKGIHDDDGDKEADGSYPSNWSPDSVRS